MHPKHCHWLNNLGRNRQKVFTGFEGSIGVMKEHGGYVFVDINAAMTENMAYIKLLVVQYMNKKHHLACSSITFFDEESISNYIHSGKKIQTCGRKVDQ